ncbi:MAG TPA: hypothetical protein VGR16_14810 [Thermomicrobiales bacterium]|nr:hypothetical protein [Thermomicrobiales bacterium]
MNSFVGRYNARLVHLTTRVKGRSHANDHDRQGPVRHHHLPPHDRFADVIIESEGEPRAVIAGYQEYQERLELREARRQEAAIAALHRISAEVAERNRDLTDEQIAALADRATREAVGALVAKGTIRFRQEP